MNRCGIASSFAATMVFASALEIFISSECNATLPNESEAGLSVVIQGNGLYSGDISTGEAESSCADFQLREKDVRELLASARPLTQREYSHDLSGSNCYASGHLTDVSGKKSWRIDRARRGLLIDSNGQATYFYCNSCLSDHYYEPCDIECEHGP